MGDFEMASGLWKEILVSALAVGFAVYAGWLDWRTRKLPNWLTVPALLLGLLLSLLLGRWPGLKASLEGAGISLAVLLPFVLARGLGAGDWKLMGALGAYLGPYSAIIVLLGTIFIAGLMSVVEVVRQRKVQETLKNLWILFVAYSTFHVNNARAFTLDNPGLLKIPFGVAAALSTVSFFLIMFLIRFFQIKLG
jgi:prepilin peptidase CpaA